MAREFEPNCAIVDSAKELAISKGLDPDRVNCPFIRACAMKDCVWDQIRFKDQTKLINSSTPETNINTIARRK